MHIDSLMSYYTCVSKSGNVTNTEIITHLLQHAIDIIHVGNEHLHNEEFNSEMESLVNLNDDLFKSIRPIFDMYINHNYNGILGISNSFLDEFLILTKKQLFIARKNRARNEFIDHAKSSDELEYTVSVKLNPTDADLIRILGYRNYFKINNS